MLRCTLGLSRMMNNVLRVDPSVDPVTRSQTLTGFGGILGQSPVMQKLCRMVAVAATSPHPVLILGEVGSGKRMVARTIRSSGPFRDRPFISIHCGLLAPVLFGGQLFDHVKGEFTGPTRVGNGRMATAKGGTIFLDNVEELDFDLQAKLVRLLQDIQNSQTTDAPVNVRILAASTHDLERVVMQGGFRKDLYCRLNVLSLRLPPLRDHRDDIPLLAEHFLERMMGASGQPTTLSEDAVQAMLSHDWPGNVRELEHCLKRACALANGPLIQVRDLPPEIVRTPHAMVSNQNTECHIVPLAEVERQAILNAVAELKGDKAKAARLLGIGKTTLYRRLRQFASDDLHGGASKAFSRVA
jgi:DNA-binding NtrC family response regulator